MWKGALSRSLKSGLGKVYGVEDERRNGGEVEEEKKVEVVKEMVRMVWIIEREIGSKSAKLERRSEVKKGEEELAEWQKK